MQHCDGLRGALVVYDPLDPMNALYDVDDGASCVVQEFFCLLIDREYDYFPHGLVPQPVYAYGAYGAYG